MKKLVSVFTVLLLVLSCLSACSAGVQETIPTQVQKTEAAPKDAKDADYLYDWLTEHGTLVGGTCLQYSETNSKGVRFSLCYDTNRTGNSRWYVTYKTEHISGYTIETKLILFWEKNKTPADITVSGFGSYTDYYRSMEYSHNSKAFTNNSPVETEDFYGSTVNIDNAEKDLIAEIQTMNTICEENAQKSLCFILDWLKESFCSTAKMTMSDFGYDSY